MRASAVGIVAVAALTVAAAFAFGTVQAEETHPIGEFMEWQRVEQEKQPHELLELMEWHPAPPVETGAIREPVYEEEWMADYGED